MNVKQGDLQLLVLVYTAGDLDAHVIYSAEFLYTQLETSVIYGDE